MKTVQENIYSLKQIENMTNEQFKEYRDSLIIAMQELQAEIDFLDTQRDIGE